jgi:hypothetical protein
VSGRSLGLLLSVLYFPNFIVGCAVLFCHRVPPWLSKSKRSADGICSMLAGQGR